DPQVRAHLLPEIYPAGDEVVLIYETLGRLVPSGGLPIQVGVIVWNVETMYNIYRALTDVQPVTHKYVMIAGEVQTPCTVHVPLGMTVAELVALAGGVTTENPVYLLGGVMTGSLGDTQDVVTKTTNAVLVLPVRHPAARKRMGTPAVQLQRAKSACCFCQMCTDLCPRHLLGHPITPHAFMGAATHEDTHDVRPYLDTRYCSACGLCEMYACTQDLSPRALIVAYKQGLAKKGVRAQEEPPAPEVLPERPYRGVPTKRLIVHLGLSPYNVPAPLADAEISTKRVRVLLRQGIGVAALPTVKAGDTVTAGQRIANAAQDALGVPVHAPIAGRVLEVNAQSLLIQA
ncbi:MAG: SLBB domain-containing protein, partial [Clostridia bacterium]